MVSIGQTPIDPNIEWLKTVHELSSEHKEWLRRELKVLGRPFNPDLLKAVEKELKPG